MLPPKYPPHLNNTHFLESLSRLTLIVWLADSSQVRHGEIIGEDVWHCTTTELGAAIVTPFPKVKAVGARLNPRPPNSRLAANAPEGPKKRSPYTTFTYM